MGDPVTSAAIGGVITSVVVGTAATKVAEGLGFNDSTSAFIGTVAGVAAGGYVGGQAMKGPAPEPSVGTDLAKATALPQSEPDLPMTPIGADSAPAKSSFYEAQSPTWRQALSVGEPGMLTQASGMIQPPAKTDVSSGTVEDYTKLPNYPGKEQQSSTFLQRMFSPEKTMDMAMAALAGIGDYTIAKEDREYDRKNIEKDRRSWTDGQYGGYSASLKHPY